MSYEDRMNALPYRPYHINNTGSSVHSISQCNRCGALVGNEKFHDEWHMKFGMEREQ